MTNEEKNQFWYKHYLAWKEQGVSRQVYCQNNNLAQTTFYNWINKLKLPKPETHSIKSLKRKEQSCLQFSEVKVINTQIPQVSTAEIYPIQCRIGFRGFDLHCSSLPAPEWLMELQMLMGRSSC